MIIRSATRVDAPQISALLTALSSTFIVVNFEQEGVDNLLGSMTTTAIEGYFDKGFRYHVGEIDSKIVGVVATRDNSHLYHLFVSEGFQGNRYASELWRVAKQACIDAGNRGRFTVNSSLNARAVYEGWGFTAIGEIREGGGVRDLPMQLG